MQLRTGGRMIVDALARAGIERVFCVPGESYLPLLDALWEARERIATITCRHEHGASMMAEADGKLGLRPGVCLVTRGPGAGNAAIGVHTAKQDSTPMLLLVGQVERAFLGREAFQEVDIEAMFRPLAKHAEQVLSLAALPAAIARALAIAVAGRPGPVVLALPEDLLAEVGDAADVPVAVASASVLPGEAMARLAERLQAARRPLLLLGGGGWTPGARTDIAIFAVMAGFPVVCSFRRNDLFDNRHPQYAGELGIAPNPRLLARLQAADLLLVVGARLGEIASQSYTVPAANGPALIHVHPDPAEPGRVFPVIQGIIADVAAFAAAARTLPPGDPARLRAWSEAARADYLADTDPPPAPDRALDLGAAMRWLREALPEDAIVCVDAGNCSGWPQRFLRVGGERRLLGPISGAMGYSVPAAIAAKLAHPDRVVVACVGDGSFGMTGIEIATAVHHRVPMVVLVFDNAMYATIRMHQERAFPGRVIATALSSPDFAALARSCGAWAECVERTADFAPAFGRALAAGGPALLHLICDPDVLGTRLTLSQLAGAGVAAAAPAE